MPSNISSIICFYRLLKTDFQQFRQFSRHIKLGDFLKIGFFGAISVGFIIVELSVAGYLFQHIMNQESLEELRYVLFAKLLHMVFLVFITILIYSNVVLSISSFFLSPELDLLHSKPIPEIVIFTYRFMETILKSSWMFIAFGLPILLAYGMVMGRGAGFPIQIFIVIIPVLILTTALGVLIGISLIRVFSPKQTQRVFLILGIFLSAGLIMIFRWMKPEQLIDPIGVEQLTFYLDTLRMPTIPWLPTSWAAEAFACYGEGNIFRNLKYGLWLWLGASLAVMASYTIFKQFWWDARSRGHGSDSIASPSEINPSNLSQPTRIRMSFFYRDILLFSRDAGQWSQLIVIAALIFIYVFNFKNMPYALYGFQYSMSYVSVGAAGLILCALQARFAYPSVSSEGRSFWLLKTAPINWRRYLWQKYLFYLIPSLIIGITLVLFSLIVLDVSLSLLLHCVAAIILITIGCNALAIGIGARYPRFDLPDSARVAVSAGGLIYMLMALSFILLIVFLIVIPDAVHYFSYYGRFLNYVEWLNQFSWTATIGITIAVTCLSMLSGIKALNQNQTS